MRLSGTVPSASAGVVAVRVWNSRRPICESPRRRRPEGRTSLRPVSIWSAPLTSISSLKKRLTWRALRATSDEPFLAWSSSSSTVIGTNTSCSSKRNSEVGSCMSTLVSRT